MKSFVAHAVAIYEGIFADASIRWPTLRVSFEQDSSYLRRVVDARGLPFLTITLPELGKVLDRALSTGYLDAASIPQGIKRYQNKPVFLRELFHQVFDSSNVLRQDVDCIDAVCFLRQFLYCCKKLRLQCDPQKTEDTLNEFFTIERQLPPSHEGTWDSDAPQWKPRLGHPLWGDEVAFGPLFPADDFPALHSRSYPWDDFRQLCRFIVSGLGTPNWWEIQPKHGPGVVSEQGGIIKYDFPFWPKKLDMWFPFDWHGSGSLDPEYLPSDYEPASRLIAVPKSQKGPRLICAEPAAHQWIQQGIWRWLEAKVRASPLGEAITFRSQENSRHRALDASRSGDSATIDLSSASDRISTRLVEYIFQGSEILDGLHASRTRVLSQNLSEGFPKRILLRKFSTMGSAVTFPIQSIIFSIISAWAIRLHDGDTRALNRGVVEEYFRQVTVFGDDIIVPVRVIETIKLVLHECGLKVNVSKTYHEGNFRESCGCDAFRGYDVTPAYALQPVDDSPSSMATTVEVANNFFLKGYWSASDVIVSSIPPAERKLLRICGSDDGAFGLRSFVGSDTSHLRYGWDKNLHRMYSVSLAIDSTSTRERGRGSSSLSQYFFERPDPDFPWSSGQVGGVRLRKRRTRVYD